MAQRISNPAIQHFDKDTNAPLSGGQLFFFEINSTTPKDTFADEEGTIPNTNPVILNAVGLEPDIFGDDSYRIVLQNSNDVQQWERDPVNFEMISGQFSDWLPTVDYEFNDIVEGSDADFYISIQTPNLNNDPASGLNPAFWSPFSLIGGSLETWLSTFDYAVDAVVAGSDSNFYSSIQTPNLGNDPTGSPTFWIRFDLLKRWNTNETFDSGDPVTFNEASYISRVASNQGNQPDISSTEWVRTGGQFRGALAFAVGVKTQILSGTIAALDLFDGTDYDTDSIFSISPNPTRLTVPTGVTKVRLTAFVFVTISGATTGNVLINMNKNAAVTPFNFIGAPTDTTLFSSPNTGRLLVSGIIDVIGGDFFELNGSETTDGTITAIGNTAGFIPASYFAMEIIE